MKTIVMKNIKQIQRSSVQYETQSNTSIDTYAQLRSFSFVSKPVSELSRQLFSLSLLCVLVIFCTVFTQAQTVQVIERPTIVVDGGLHICDSTTVRVHCTSGFNAYRWMNGRMDSVENILFALAGDIPLWVEVEDQAGHLWYSDTLHVIVSNRPAAPTIQQVKNMVVVNAVKGCHYQWYYNDLIIGGPQTTQQQIFQDGWYKVRAIDSVNQCWRESAEFFASLSDVSEQESESIEVSPQPAGNIVRVSWNNVASGSMLQISLWSLSGQAVVRKSIISSSNNSIDVDLSAYSTQTFVCELRSASFVKRCLIVHCAE